jgi:hypothetical protein
MAIAGGFLAIRKKIPSQHCEFQNGASDDAFASAITSGMLNLSGELIPDSESGMKIAMAQQ